MQLIISNLETWCKQWGMALNTKKCSVMHFGRQNPKTDYILDGQKLATLCTQKDLGVTISDDCLPQEQCALAAKKANQVLGQVNRSFSCFTKDIMLKIFKVFVRPHLEYAAPAWSPWLRKDIDTLEKIQRRATRRISNIKGSYPERMKQLGLTTLEERRQRGDAIEMFKFLRGFWNIEHKTLFTLQHNREPKTRHQQSFLPLNVPRAKLDLRNNFFCVRGAKLWNSLPSKVRESSSINMFKNSYDSYVSNK